MYIVYFIFYIVERSRFAPPIYRIRFKVLGSGFKVPGSRFWVLGLKAYEFNGLVGSFLPLNIQFRGVQGLGFNVDDSHDCPLTY